MTQIKEHQQAELKRLHGFQLNSTRFSFLNRLVYQRLLHRTISIFLFLVLTCYNISCTNEYDAAYVDFSNRMAIERPSKDSQGQKDFRVAVAAIISAQETVGNYHQLLSFIANKLERKIKLIQRKTYNEINELIGLGQIDLAFICSGPYANDRKKYGFEALAMPEVRGSPFYQAYLIVNQVSPYESLSDLKGKIFAFTDPDSNTGRLVPTYWLKKKGTNPEGFFGKTIYTHSHDNSIMAVAMSLVDGATVNSQIWEYYHHRNPAHTANTRILKKSQLFGTPPVVAPANMPAHMKDRIRALLMNMHHDPEGKKILDGLMIDRFIAPIEERYDPIIAMNNNN